MISRASLHYWEEPCISGEEGSGTVFFSGCSLKCVYCQNRQIALGHYGMEISVQRLAEIFFELKEKGANNINLVTGTHFAHKIIEAIDLAGKENVGIPFILNTGGYEESSLIRELSPYIDIYLTDFKYWDRDAAERYSNAPDYIEKAKTALEEMVSTKGEPVYDDRGIMLKGVIVRHLVLPGRTEDAKSIIEYVYRTYGEKVVLSILNQYTPVKGLNGYPEINRRLTTYEYEKVLAYAEELGIENAYIQTGDTAKESFIPDFGAYTGVLNEG